MKMKLTTAERIVSVGVPVGIALGVGIVPAAAWAIGCKLGIPIRIKPLDNAIARVASFLEKRVIDVRA